MTDATIEEAKAVLRNEAKARRAALTDDERTEAARIAARHFFDALPIEAGAVVAGYWPIRDEFDCRPILVRLVDSGQPVCLPVTDGEAPLLMRLWAANEPLYPSGFGTLAPLDSAPIVEPDVILVPLLGFDAEGTRLGYGKGHYDRMLALMEKAPQLIGVAFAAQEFEHIPHGPHDVPLDAVLTEAGVRSFARVAAQ